MAGGWRRRRSTGWAGPRSDMLRDALFLQFGYNATLVAIGATLLGVAAGVTGTFLFLRKRALVSDAISHATLPGVGLAFIVMVAFGSEGRNLVGLLAGSALSAGVGLLCMSWLTRHTRLAEDAAIGPDVRGEDRVRRLWDLARLPDFRKAGHEGHGRLVLGLAETLADPDARLGDKAMEMRLENLEASVPDIASLQHRLAMIRTWTYAAHRDDWLENPSHWRERTREIEDRLSDALHAALTLRFVDRRTTALLAGLKREDLLVTELSENGEVTVEGHVVGKLIGLQFEPASTART